MEKIELEIIALSHSITQSHSYAVVLGEKYGAKRRLPIVIGGFEAQAIAIAIENIEPTRPLTHDLMKNMLSIFEVALKQVVINDLKNGVFYSQLICEHNGQTFEIDSRTSDAIALATRFDTPIFTYEPILESAGIQLDEEELQREGEEGEEEPEMATSETTESMATTDMSEKSVDDLKLLLEEAIDQEDYERAAKIRDEINKRSGN